MIESSDVAARAIMGEFTLVEKQQCLSLFKGSSWKGRHLELSKESTGVGDRNLVDYKTITWLMNRCFPMQFRRPKEYKYSRAILLRSEMGPFINTGHIPSQLSNMSLLTEAILAAAFFAICNQLRSTPCAMCKIAFTLSVSFGQPLKCAR
ncbi:hypothetical protein CEXT_680381 [Caerostris extrusa]|uniref:Uncharacterized protein n=1 Tax=Caerostris extrusa TaxID=172846 RepID=A0AAV4P1S9_CAEEX|nr:hypothetical protein CEXT_680381 [Caerostris extrusa]